VHLQEYYRQTIDLDKGQLPNTEWNSERVCSLPLSATMTLGDVDDVVDAIENILVNNT
jgi:UDP-4-amino-4-deoxy-L-arabinose-oxoglutarate aminotransferase